MINDATGIAFMIAIYGHMNISTARHDDAAAAITMPKISARKKPSTMREKLNATVCQDSASPISVKSRSATVTGETSSKLWSSSIAAACHTKSAARTAAAFHMVMFPTMPHGFGAASNFRF